MVTAGTRLTVIAPTYRRADSLADLLDALSTQHRRPDEVVIVHRSDDRPSAELLARRTGCLPLEVVETSRGGQVAAMNAALEVATGDLIAITDDDTIPPPAWLLNIERRFGTDDRIGGVGGPDRIGGRPVPVERQSRSIGRITRTGKVIGNHHLGGGCLQSVETLKGANMSFRRAAIEGLRFDERLRGAGAQLHNDMAFCFAVRRRGWTLVYDPAVEIAHFPATRPDGDRLRPDRRAVHDGAFNETLVMLEHLGRAASVTYLARSLLVGTRRHPGILRVVLGLGSPRESVGTFVSCVRGRRAGIAAHVSKTAGSTA